MRALTFSTFGGPEVLEVQDLPEREPGPGWVRIRVAAATVNPTDIGFRGGRQAANLGDLKPPYIPGMEFAGTVDSAGEGSEWIGSASRTPSPRWLRYGRHAETPSPRTITGSVSRAAAAAGGSAR